MPNYSKSQVYALHNLLKEEKLIKPLCEKLGVSRTYISNVFLGKSPMTIRVFNAATEIADDHLQKLEKQQHKADDLIEKYETLKSKIEQDV